jgi:hypothetical protein
MGTMINRFAPLFAGAVLTLSALCASAQQPTQPRKFQTTYKIDMYAAPDENAKKIGNVPANVVLESQEETERYGGYIKVTFKNKTGYIFKAEVKRYMDTPAPELVCWSNGYKIINGVYRYYFVLRNDGTLPYVGKITIRLFDKDGKMIFEKTADYSDGLAAESAGLFNIDTLTHAPDFELEHKDGKIKGSTGKFIERL